MVQSAIVILQETARCCSSLVFGHIAKTNSTSETVSLPRLPSAGGVYSPGYAFADTTLVARFLFHLQTAVSHPSKKELISTMPSFLLFRLNKKEVTFTSVVEDI